MNEDEILESVIGFDALYESMNRCKSGVIWKTSVSSFVLNAIPNVLTLEEQLKNGTYKPRKPKEFEITYPKRRTAVSISFRDRVYQRSLNDNQIYPQISRSLIYDNCACQKDKGTDFARERLETFLHKFYRKHGRCGWVLKCDIKGYYPNMRHDVTSEYFREHLDPVTFEMANTVLNEQYHGEVGYNPGSQMIQIAGISVLNNLDHYIKERLRVKYYLRYMDDFILIHESKEFLIECKKQIEEELGKIGFELHSEKTGLQKASKPIDFLGFSFHLSETGKVYKQILPDTVKRERKRLVRLVHLANSGKITGEKADQCYNSWRNHASKGDTYRLLQRMDKFYKELWDNEYI